MYLSIYFGFNSFPRLSRAIYQISRPNVNCQFRGCTCGYLDNYKKHRTKLLREHGKQRADDYKLTVYTTWQISFEKLSPEAATFLQLCAFMHHDGIFEEIFRKATTTTFVGAPSSATNFLCNFLDANRKWDTTRFLDMTNELQRYSLINFQHVNKV